MAFTFLRPTINIKLFWSHPWPSVDKPAYRVTAAATSRNNFAHNHGEMLDVEQRETGHGECVKKRQDYLQMV